MRKEQELDSLLALNKTVIEIVDGVREEISRDPLAVLPARLMKEIQEQIPDIHDVLTPAPLTLQLDGIRIKLPYESYLDAVRNLELDDRVVLADVADILPSKMKNYILVKIRRKSETGFVM
jgi:methyl coenzyme M reductase subunit C-like uncharacterized protein (methanogenesis marker protein 7)